jgi:tyrosinase
MGTACSSVYHEAHPNDSPCVTKPVRKDWEALSPAEKETFTSAVNKLKESGKYDEMVKLHSQAYHMPSPWNGHDDANILVRNGDQKGPAFLPWHRQQLILYEEALQRVSGDYTLAVP